MCSIHITLKDVEEKIKPLGNRLSYDKEFIFDLLAVYGRAQGNITRLRNGQLNIANDKVNEVAQKSTVYFKPVAASGDGLSVDLLCRIIYTRYKWVKGLR